MSRILGFWLAILLIFSGGMLIWMLQRGRVQSDREVSASASHPAPSGPKMTEFELVDQTGQHLKSNELKGRIWTGSFFFCSCPSTCYNQNMKLAQIQAQFANQGLISVSITCDPANDTPVALAHYASRFNADSRTWKFATPPDADVNYVQRIGSDFFNVAVREETHTDRVMVVNRTGVIRGSFSVLQPEQFTKLQELVTELLAEADVESAGPPPSSPPTENAPTSASDARDAANSHSVPSSIPVSALRSIEPADTAN